MDSVPIFIAIDRGDYDEALKFALLATELKCGIKLGLEFFIKNGHDGSLRIMEQCEKEYGRRPILFLDLKLHDIPNTIKGAVKSSLILNPDFMTLHASGGQRMLAEAVNVVKEANAPTKLVAVTVLTSLNSVDLYEIGFSYQNPQTLVLKFAETVLKSGIHHVVCAPHELPALRNQYGSQLTYITPGIRPFGSEDLDQRRTLTPNLAMKQGASYLVIGRPITQSINPHQTLINIIKEIHYR